MTQIGRRRKLGLLVSRRAVMVSLLAVMAVMGLTAAMVAVVFGELDRIDRIGRMNVEIGAHKADLRGIGPLAARVAALPPGDGSRLDLAGRAVQVANGLSARMAVLTADPRLSPPDAERLGYELSRLDVLTAMVAAAEPGVPLRDIVVQIEDIAERSQPRLLAAWRQDLAQQAVQARRGIDWALAAYCLSVLFIVLLMWRFVLTPLARSLRDGDDHTQALQDALTHSAGHDRLTGLPNRRHAARLLEALLARRRKVPLGVLHVDLFQFRALNEELGHDEGDAVLTETARRLTGMTRDHDFAARIGGDEFFLLQTDIGSPEALERRAMEVRRELRAPMQLASGARSIDCMIGHVWSDGAGADAAQLSMRADIALHAAMSGTDGPLRAFTRAMQEEVARREGLGRDLRLALERDELVMHFQPQVCAVTGEIAGFEALLRWYHPGRGIVAPGAFLSLAEEIGLADEIGSRVLDQSLDALGGWLAAGFDVPHVAVNYSAAQLADPLLADRIKWAVDRRDLHPGRLALEVVETVAVDSEDALAVRTIGALAQAGFAIELDDFGTAHASIANIRRFQASRIKIDRSFVSGIDTRDDLYAMADAMVRMAKALGVGTIAEGVETAEERARVVALGCDAIQGYNIARPMPFEDTLPWLAEQRIVSRGSRRRVRGAA